MRIPEYILNRVFSKIQGEELAKLALDLGRIRGPSGCEQEVGEYVYGWMRENDLNPMKQVLSEQRFNVIGLIRGKGGGKSLAFNSHLDTAPVFEGEAQAGREDYSTYRSWADGDRLYGLGLMNCRGPMAVWMITAKALRESGLQIGGDVVLTAVIGEIGLAPVDEYQGPQYLGKGYGTEQAVRFGPAVDYAIVAETTDFGVAWAECGVLYLRIMVKGKRVYSPRLKEYTDIREHPNAILKMVKLIEAVESWARGYETKNVLAFPGGVIRPKVNIGAIRGGFPPWPGMTAETCSIFLSVRLLPEEGGPRVIQEIREALSATGIETEISSYCLKKGHIGKDIDPLLHAIRESYEELGHGSLPGVSSEVTSMWRDLNIYNENGIPSVTFGPKRYTDEQITPRYGIKYLVKEDLVKAAQIYAMAALKICGWTE